MKKDHKTVLDAGRVKQFSTLQFIIASYYNNWMTSITHTKSQH